MLKAEELTDGSEEKLLNGSSTERLNPNTLFQAGRRSINEVQHLEN